VGQVNRRAFLVLVAGLGASSGCGVLPFGGRKPVHVGVLAPDDGAGPRWDAFRSALQDLGWLDGQNLRLTWRTADGSNDLLGKLAAELVSLPVDVLVTGGTEGAIAAQRATRTIPTVVAAMNDPVGSGLVASYGRPGGNLTGCALLSPELTPKRLELLRDLMPRLERLAVLANGENSTTPALLDQVRAVAAGTLQLRILDARTPDDLPHAFDQATNGHAQAMLVLPDFLFYVSRAQLARLAADARLPVLYSSREYAEAGGLMTYGANQADLYRRAAGLVDRILNGAYPADLPIEQPSTFELVVNTTAAQRLGLNLPTSITLQARLIQ
jgi:putative ABC transport system substrate-binding protein